MKLWLTLLVIAAAGLGFGGPLDSNLFTVRSDNRECGSAFLMMQDDASWMVSNCHVVRGSGEIEYVGMTDASRVFSLPETIEVAANRDAVRFPVDGDSGFALTDTYDFDELVYAFGNSGGAGVVTKSKGKVVGKGRGEIEVTCEIIPGNSGGPVVNKDNEVIGISTYIIMAPSKQYSSSADYLTHVLQTRKGTRYEDSRRFAVPLHNAQWQPVDRDVFKAEAAVEQLFSDQYGQFEIMVASVFLSRPVATEDIGIVSGSWLRSYNRKLSDLGYYSSDGTSYVVRSGKQDSFKRTLRKWLKDLSDQAGTLAKKYEDAAGSFTVLYFKNQMLDRAKELHATRAELLKTAGGIEI